MSVLLEPFAYGYMTRAIVICALVGVLCGALSALVTLKGWSLIGDALAHSVVPGVAVAALLGLPLAAGAAVSAGLAAAGIVAVGRVRPLKGDVAIGLVFTTLFAAGLLVASLAPQSIRVSTILLGDVLAIPDAEAWQVVGAAGLGLATLAALWRPLVCALFDPRHARAVGLSPSWLRAALFAIVAASTLCALQAVGAVLVVAMLVTPGATARLLVDRIGPLARLAALLGGVSGAVGAYASFFLDGATGGLIVVGQTLLFLAAFAFAPRHGWLARRRRGAVFLAERSALADPSPRGGGAA